METEIVRFSSKAESIFYESAQLEQIATGYAFTEGPVWDGKAEALYFTDFSHDAIHRWERGGGASLYTGDARRSVGLTLSKDGRIVAAQTRAHAIAYIDETSSDVIADSIGGKRLNSPNDVLAAKQGDLFFTDPYSKAMGDVRELDYNGVFRIAPGKGEPMLLDGGMLRPNGLAFSPGEDILYVDDTDEQSIVAFAVRSDRTLSKTGTFAVMDTAYGKGAADGMKVDIDGNIYLTGPGGIWIYGSDAAPIAILLMPEPAGNLCFGMNENSTLIITASSSVYASSVYAIDLKIPGIVPPRN